MKPSTKQLFLSAAIATALTAPVAHADKAKTKSKGKAPAPTAQLGKCTQSNSCHAQAVDVNGKKLNNTCGNHVTENVTQSDCDKMKGKWEANAT